MQHYICEQSGDIATEDEWWDDFINMDIMSWGYDEYREDMERTKENFPDWKEVGHLLDCVDPFLLTFCERLNFSNRSGHDSAIRIERRKDVNHFETLCLYCAENDIDLDEVGDDEFDTAVSIMRVYGEKDPNWEYYYFWIDN